MKSSRKFAPRWLSEPDDRPVDVHVKLHLPEKVCAACGLAFAWRRKWKRSWDDVKYCSKRCRLERRRRAGRA